MNNRLNFFKNNNHVHIYIYKCVSDIIKQKFKTFKKKIIYLNFKKGLIKFISCKIISKSVVILFKRRRVSSKGLRQSSTIYN